MQLTRRDFAAVLGAPLAMAMTACAFLRPGPNTPPAPTALLSLIQNIVSSAESALGTIGTYVGLSSDTVKTFGNWLAAVGSAATGVIQAIESGSVLTKVDNVVQVLASFASAPLLAGVVPAPVAIIIAGVAAAVDAFIKFLPASPSTTPAGRRLTLPPDQRHVLGSLRTRAQALTANAVKLSQANPAVRK